MAARLVVDNRALVRSMVQAALQNSLRDAASVLSDQARARVPIDTGALFASISAQPTGVLRYRVVADKEYSLFVEAGTSRQAAQPYLMPAAIFVNAMMPSILRRNFVGF